MQQDSLLDDAKVESSKGPVECLGQTFENEEARREHFTKILSVKLKDPEFRKIEGFPIGTDEAILELSDAPYYTACPNPWLNDFVEYWESKKENAEEEYHREPFAADVSEGKNDPIYNAHSYHTKVPHKAIMRYILHYTNPGDIVYDGFCGTGMTGVAAQLCGDINIVESLGYNVTPDGIIEEKIIDADTGIETWCQFSKIGARECILSDLSPAATFIANNYNKPIEYESFIQESESFLNSIRKSCSWMYETEGDNGVEGEINYVIWSEVFVCPECTGELIFWDVAVDIDNGIVRDSYPCTHCGVELTKRKMSRAKTSYFDDKANEVVKYTKSVPVRINFSVAGERKARNKKPSQKDLELIEKIHNTKFDSWYPSDEIMDGDKTPEATRQGYLKINHLFTDRNLLAFSNAWENAPKSLKWAITGSIQRGSKQHQIAISRIGGPKAGVGGATAGHRRGTLYIPSNQVEMSVLLLVKERVAQIKKSMAPIFKKNLVQIASASDRRQTELRNYLDYVFIDPPFGSNIMYSELSQIWESWLQVYTNNKEEAIENKTQNKNLDKYRQLMTDSFKKIYSALKPGRWMTVEFSNTKAAVWNTIQTSIAEAGFIIANVASLNKGRGGLNSIVGVTAVKQDLVISAYKPDADFERRFIEESDEQAVWDFVRTHLSYLKVIKRVDNELIKISERDPRILFDQLIAYFVRNHRSVPISTTEFQEGLNGRFIERDGMFFLPEQVLEYDKERILKSSLRQLTIFVDDEASGIEWLRQLLGEKPQTYQDIHPKFINELSGWKKNEVQLELMTLLEQNFIKYNGNDDVPNQIHTYLSTNFKDMRSLAKNDCSLIAKAKDRWYVPDPSKTGDIEKLRLRALLREFEHYKEEKKKIKQPRAEALRAGFNACWEKQDLQTILDISAKIPPAVLQEDEKLLMFYDNALTLTSNNDDDWD